MTNFSKPFQPFLSVTGTDTLSHKKNEAVTTGDDATGHFRLLFTYIWTGTICSFLYAEIRLFLRQYRVIKARKYWSAILWHISVKQIRSISVVLRLPKYKNDYLWFLATWQGFSFWWGGKLMSSEKGGRGGVRLWGTVQLFHIFGSVSRFFWNK